MITVVKTSCGCTVADYTPTPVLPKAFGFVKVTYNAAAVGIFSKNVFITTADPKEPVLMLTINGEVLKSESK
ncbi:DUF1573 domain-containing protein [Mucilaginibacter sp. UYCu711]|uniref:DUF1573 domain-containing protein n=1 Tax=Mucilaginibacter sp. UYCu711 TaxID=3156339 RepID=UPI003D21D2F3